MTLYKYVPNKEALLDLISDHMLRQVEVPPPGAGDWDDRMRLLQRETRAAVASIGFRFGGGMRQSPEAARLAAGAMAILSDGGFDDDTAEQAFAMLLTFMLGQFELDALVGSGNAVDNWIRPAVDRDAQFEFALDAMLDGLRVRLAQSRQR